MTDISLRIGLSSWVTRRCPPGATTDEIRIGTTRADVLPPPRCIGDLDGNRFVDLTDLATLLARFGTSC